MSIEHIANRLERLPPSLQREVLDFIEFLSQKVTNGEAASEDAAWQRFSLAQAMKGLDDEESPEYSEADLKERWR